MIFTSEPYGDETVIINQGDPLSDDWDQQDLADYPYVSRYGYQTVRIQPRLGEYGHLGFSVNGTNYVYEPENSEWASPLNRLPNMQYQDLAFEQASPDALTIELGDKYGWSFMHQLEAQVEGSETWVNAIVSGDNIQLAGFEFQPSGEPGETLFSTISGNAETSITISRVRLKIGIESMGDIIGRTVPVISDSSSLTGLVERSTELSLIVNAAILKLDINGNAITVHNVPPEYQRQGFIRIIAGNTIDGKYLMDQMDDDTLNPVHEIENALGNAFTYTLGDEISLIVPQYAYFT